MVVFIQLAICVRVCVCVCALCNGVRSRTAQVIEKVYSIGKSITEANYLFLFITARVLLLDWYDYKKKMDVH